MRKVLYQLLREAIPEIPADRIYQFGSMTEPSGKPFAIYRLSGRMDRVTTKSAMGSNRVEVWIHDEPGSYSRIERLLSAVEDKFLAVTHRVVGDQSISQIGYDSRSPDLYDEGFKSICKMSSFTIVGKR